VSPIAIDALTESSVGLSAVRIDGDHLYWLEAYADQAGRTSLWRCPLSGGEASEVTPAPAYVRNRVHEYGGGEYDVRDGVVVVCELSDDRVWVITEDRPPYPITPEGDLRYGDLRVHPDRKLVLAVREDHRGDGEPVNTIVALDLDGDNADSGQVLCSGADFYSTPELSASGRLAWTEWNHPNMPWDSTTIMVGDLVGDRVRDPVRVAGGPGESAIQPRWSGDTLLLLSDRTNWWNLYAWTGRELRPLHPAEAEFGFAQWNLGMTPYAVAGADQLACTVNENGTQHVALLTVSTGDLVRLTEPGHAASSLAAGSGQVAAVLGHPERPTTVCLLDRDQPEWTDVREASSMIMDSASVSVARTVTWPSEQGPVFGWYYPPANRDYAGPDGTRPPLIISSHGGPTGAALPDFRLAYQFWTTRGFAILDVNYSGSVGFGRAYRDRLLGAWGVADVRDCAAGALAMVDQGLADADRLVIRGGSAGGYTTLRALTTTTIFAAGISQYGIGDLEALARDTHKFEARYLDRLIGPYPEARDLYRDRSPVHHLDRLAAPILLLQGAEDKVVPPAQAEAVAAAARIKGLPVALIMFPGEGHGFRRSDSIRTATEAQIYFLGRILGHQPADQVPSIPIDNLDP
jgi:dipeptidyl aminopeptidase/acylaminoacyl peptidase